MGLMRMLSLWRRARLAHLKQLVPSLVLRGKYDRAKEMALLAHDLSLSVHGPHDVEYGIALDNLSSVYRALEEYTTAERYGRMAATIIERAVGKRDLQYVVAVGNLGSLYLEMGRTDAARTLLEGAAESLCSLLEGGQSQGRELAKSIAACLSVAGSPTVSRRLLNALSKPSEADDELEWA